MDEARLFAVVHSDRTRSNGLKPKHRKFHTNVQKNFMVRVIEHWYRLPSEVVESPSMVRPIQMPTCVTYCGVPALAGGLVTMIS